MANDSKRLNIPLYTVRDWNWLWLIFASLILAALLTPPASLVQWLVNCLIVAPAIWFAFVGPSSLYQWQLNHRYAFVGWAVMAIKLVALLFVHWYVAPLATAKLTGWLQ